MAYQISNGQKKTITEVEKWKKGDEYLVHRIGWRWGNFKMPAAPDLSEYDPETDEIEIYSEWDDVEMLSLDDGCWEEWEYPDSWTDEDKEKFEEAWEEEWHEAPLNLGWEEEDTELWITGPIDIEEIEDESDDGDEEAVDENSNWP